MHQIRLATLADAASLPSIEKSAGELFRSIPDLAWIAEDDVQTVDTHMAFISRGLAWVATDAENRPVGFLNGEEIDGRFHIWEMSVHSNHQRKGYGARLIIQAKQFAKQQGYPEITLTTFRGVAWNDAFYSSLGFKEVARDQLSQALSEILADEAEKGLPATQRCAMVLKL